MMDAAQLQQLLQVVANANRGNPGGTRRLTPLATTDGAAWRVWRRAYVQTAAINGWDNLRQRREIYASMEGEAARTTQDLEPLNFVDAQAMLDAYEARFVPAADTKLSRAQFETARQLPNELMTAWHGRLRELYIRAFPGQDVENSPILIDQFIKRLYDRRTAEWVIHASPNTFAQALVVAQNAVANQMFLDGAKPNPKTGINALNDTAVDDMDINLINSNVTCWFCKKSGHIRDECREFSKMLDYFCKLLGVKPTLYKGKKGKTPPEESGKEKPTTKTKKKKNKIQAISEPEAQGN